MQTIPLPGIERRGPHLYVLVPEKAEVVVLDRADREAPPDNLRYDPVARRIYIGYGEGAIGMIDPATDKRLPSVYKLAGNPEGFELEAKGGRIFVNVEDGHRAAASGACRKHSAGA